MDLGMYNKTTDEVPTLIGNWVQERATKDVTGSARYKDFRASVVEAPKTHQRIVAHDQDERQQNYETEFSSTYKRVYAPFRSGEVSNSARSGEMDLRKFRNEGSNFQFGSWQSDMSTTSHSALLSCVRMNPLPPVRHTTRADERPRYDCVDSNAFQYTRPQRF
jgi:hypothetical protein